MIASIFTGQFSFDMLNGPVGIYHNVDSVVKQGIIALTYYTALLSVNLGIMNLLPIPDLMVVEFYLLSMKQFSEDQLIKSRNNYNSCWCYFCLNYNGSSNLERYTTLFLVK